MRISQAEKERQRILQRLHIPLRGMNVEEDYDATLRRVAQRPEIQKLNFWGTFDGEALRHLRGHAGLIELHLQVRGFKDESLKMLASLPNLTDLILASRDSFHDEALCYVRQCPKLEFLNIYSEQLTAAGCREVFGMKTLLRLEFEKVDFAFPAFEAGQLPALRKLKLRGQGIDDKVAASLHHLPALRHLSLADSALTDEGFTHLLRLKNLDALAVDHTRITSASLQRLDQLPKLEEFFCRGVVMDEPTVTALCRLSSLMSLIIFDSGMTAVQKARLRKALPKCDVNVLD